MLTHTYRLTLTVVLFDILIYFNIKKMHTEIFKYDIQFSTEKFTSDNTLVYHKCL